VPTGARFNGTADASWQVTCAPAAASGTPCPVSGAQPAQRANNGFVEWIAPPSGSEWIGMNDRGTLSGGVGDNAERYVYTYRLTFTVVGTPSTARVSLSWACDNYFHGWSLNGRPLQDGQSQNANWLTLKTLTISSTNATFVQGTNTLEFRIVGDGITDGFLVTNPTVQVQ
jgi:hypothetical protein